MAARSDSDRPASNNKGGAARWGSDRPVPNIKGGGFKGGPKRWTGHGPAPARHIPWPEIFKHHISLCEGHLKMVDMVRKHTIEGSGNWHTIMGCVNRTKDMMREIKQISRTFVPPSNQRDKVPLGSSSASMYPGYSPADHEYGKAAEEYGKAAAEARAKGIEIKHPEAEYTVGQGKGFKRMSLAAMREAKAAGESGSGSDTGSAENHNAGPSPTKLPSTNGDPNKDKVEEPAAEGDNPYFVIDTKPTPVNIANPPNHPTKRSVSPAPEAVEGKKHKKAKRKHEHASPKGEDTNGMQFEDISKEVDVRMKEKEENRKRKEEKKRKRESEGEPAASAVTTQGTNGTATEVEKPKKKKTKHSSGESLADSKKRSGESDGALEDGEGKKKKRKKHKAPANDA